jgi:hypothetical protein
MWSYTGSRNHLCQAIRHSTGAFQVATRPKRKSPSETAAERKEAATFLAALKRHSQVQESDGPLKPGVTHVLKPAAAKGKGKQLVRKRFSAI